MRLADADSDMWVIHTEGKTTGQETDENERNKGTGRADILGRAGDTVSLIPLDERADGIVTHGLEYPLRGETLTRGSTRGISNVMTGEFAQVTLTYGTLLVVHLLQ